MFFFVLHEICFCPSINFIYSRGPSFTSTGRFYQLKRFHFPLVLARKLKFLLAADEMDLNWDDDEDQEYLQVKSVTVMPWLDNLSNHCASEWRKEISHVKKQKWVFKDGQDPGYQRLVKMCATKLGSDQTVALFGKLGRENGLDELNMLIKICIQTARETTDEDVSLREIYKAYQLFLRVRESGFRIEEKTYGQFLMYLIDFEMSDEFFFFHELIREDNPNSLPRLTYYEMLLRVRVDDVYTLQQLCLSIATERDENYYRRGKLLQSLQYRVRSFSLYPFILRLTFLFLIINGECNVKVMLFTISEFGTVFFL